MTFPAPVCMDCKNYDRLDIKNHSCKAFNEIPVSIMQSKNDHTKPFGGEKKDKDGKPILFEPNEL